MTEVSTDVLIAGGGPGGLSAAEAAARAGCRVILAEQNQEIGSPTRTSGGSFVSEMNALGVPADEVHPCGAQMCMHLAAMADERRVAGRRPGQPQPRHSAPSVTTSAVPLNR